VTVVNQHTDAYCRVGALRGSILSNSPQAAGTGEQPEFPSAGTTVQESFPPELARNAEALRRADIGFKSIGAVEPTTHRRVVQAGTRACRVVVFTAIPMKASSVGGYLRSLYDHQDAYYYQG
jgi:hypothetical protein